MPVSRADPLKDPTFDYMPPVLERVKYWSSDGTSHKNRNEILLLGMPSKKHIAMNKIDKYGPVKRTYYSTPYQSHFPSQNHQQQQQQPSQSVSFHFVKANKVFFYGSKNYMFCTASTAHNTIFALKDVSTKPTVTWLASQYLPFGS